MTIEEDSPEDTLMEFLLRGYKETLSQCCLKQPKGVSRIDQTLNNEELVAFAIRLIDLFLNRAESEE